MGMAMGVVESVIRVLAMGAALAAAIVMGTSKQTKLVPVSLTPSIIFAPVPAKFHYSSAFVFFVVANAIACTYALLSIFMSVLKNKNSKSSVFLAFILSITDMVMVGLVAAGVSAATAIAVVGYKGNRHTNWGKICNVYHKFCHHVSAALAVSYVALALFIILTIMSLSTLYRRTK